MNNFITFATAHVGSVLWSRLREQVENTTKQPDRPRVGQLLRRLLVRWTAMLMTSCLVATANAQVCAIPGRDGPATTAGILNTYYAPVIATGTTLTVGGGTANIGLTGARGATATLVPGDLLLVMQMQCENINTTNTSAYGAGGTTGSGYTDPAGSCLAGRYEYVKAGAATTATSLDLTGSALTNTYVQDAPTVANRRTFQIIRVPQYSSLTLNGAVQSPYWDGTTGGVVVLDVAGQFNWNGNAIDVTGRGFRGGGGPDQGAFAVAANAFAPYVINNAEHAQKGEGIAGTPQYVWDVVAAASVDNGATFGGYSGGNVGRGAPGNAGGGGANHDPARDNGGGGGGGNGGAGGFGSLGWRNAGWADAAAAAAGYPNVPPDDAMVISLTLKL